MTWVSVTIPNEDSDWFDCTTNFKCPCGTWVMLEGFGETVACECGREYRMRVQIECKTE